jgi:ubiquinone/menaquinone biosynthesis C-methylase UbiE
MTVEEASQLIHSAFQGQTQPADWADLGCGTGTFTRALVQCLPKDSQIWALDKSRSALQEIPDSLEGLSLQKERIDFLEWEPENPLDGILMANSLHYIQKQKIFLEKAAEFLTEDGIFLFVEYETERGNPWVPYPLSFRKLQILASELGFFRPVKIGERPSVYQRAGMYAAQVRPGMD